MADEKPIAWAEGSTVYVAGQCWPMFSIDSPCGRAMLAACLEAEENHRMRSEASRRAWATRKAGNTRFQRQGE